MTDQSNTVFATFRIWGKDLMPDEVTQTIGMIPTDSHKAGDPRGKSGNWDSGYWEVSSRDMVISQAIEDHIDWLVSQCSSKKLVLDALRERSYKMDIICFVNTEQTNFAIVLDKEVISKIANLALGISYDIYCGAETGE